MLMWLRRQHDTGCLCVQCQEDSRQPLQQLSQQRRPGAQEARASMRSQYPQPVMTLAAP